MDFLNKASAQLADLFKSMTPGARLTAGMLLVLIVVSLTFLVAQRGGGPRVYLFGSQEFAREDIVRMQKAFAAANLDDYEFEGGRVRVPSRRRLDYVQALNKADFDLSGLDADVAKIEEQGAGMFASREDKEWRRKVAKERHFKRTLEMRPEVEWATAQYSETKEPGFPPQVRRGATVILASVNGRPLSRSTISDIRNSAASWFNVPVENVAITDQNGPTIPFGGFGDGLDAESRPYIVAKAWHQDDYERKINNVLSYIGSGVIAVVEVDLDDKLANESTKVTVDPQTVSVKTETLTKTQETSPPDGARPGARPNEVAGEQQRSLAARSQQPSSSEESREQLESVTGHEQVRQVTAGLVPRRVTATVSIPESYIARVRQQQLPPGYEDPAAPTQAELDAIKAQLDEIRKQTITNIENQVVKVLPGLPPGEDQFPLVTVTTYHDIPAAPPEQPSLVTLVVAWLSSNWKSLGLLTLGLVSLLVLRNMLRSVPTSAAANLAAETAAPPDSMEEELEKEDHQPVLTRHHARSGASLREELISIVREDPDAAANVLRTWIGDAA